MDNDFKFLIDAGLDDDVKKRLQSEIQTTLKQIKDLEILISRAKISDGARKQLFDALKNIKTLSANVENATLSDNAKAKLRTAVAGLDNVVANIDSARLDPNFRTSLQGLLNNLNGLTVNIAGVNTNNQQLTQQAQQLGQQFGNNLNRGLANALNGNQAAIQRFVDGLRNIGVNEVYINDILQRVNQLGLSIQNLSSVAQTANNTIQVEVIGLDEMENAIRVVQRYNALTGAYIDGSDRIRVTVPTVDVNGQYEQALRQRADAYRQILTIDNQIARLDQTTNAQQIAALREERNAQEQIRITATDTMNALEQQVRSTEELNRLNTRKNQVLTETYNIVSRTTRLQDAQNAEKTASKEQKAIDRKLEALQNKLDVGQGKYNSNYIDQQVQALIKYGYTAQQAEQATLELRNAFNSMNDVNANAQTRLNAEQQYQKAANQTSAVVKEARLEWQGLASDQQRLASANRIEAFMQKNTRITKEAKDELTRYVAQLRGLGTEMSKVEKSNIDTKFKHIENSMRGLHKLGYKLTDQFKQAAGSFAQWMSVTHLMMTGIYKTRQAVTELKDINTYLTEISKANDQLSKSDLAEIGNNSFDIASKYGKTATDFLSAVQEASRAGYADAEGIAELSTAAQGAGNMTADVANQMLIATDKAYKMNGAVEQLRKTLDGVNYITNHNAVNMTELSEGMTIVASTAASFGVDVNELTAALGTMSATTQQSGSEVARAFRAILLNIRQVSDK